MDAGAALLDRGGPYPGRPGGSDGLVRLPGGPGAPGGLSAGLSAGAPVGAPRESQLWSHSIAFNALTPLGPGVVAEPLPAGVWIRAAQESQASAKYRSWLYYNVASRLDLFRVVIGYPGAPPLPIGQVAEFCRLIPAALWPEVRFARFGPVTRPDGEAVAFGQALADLVDQIAIVGTGVRIMWADPGGGSREGAMLPDGAMTWMPFAMDYGYTPRSLTEGIPVDPVAVDAVAPITGLAEARAGVFPLGEDTVLEVVQSGLWLRPVRTPPGAAQIRAAAADPQSGNLIYDTSAKSSTARMARLAAEVLQRIGEGTRAAFRLRPAHAFARATAGLVAGATAGGRGADRTVRGSAKAFEAAETIELAKIVEGVAVAETAVAGARLEETSAVEAAVAMSAFGLSGSEAVGVVEAVEASGLGQEAVSGYVGETVVEGPGSGARLVGGQGAALLAGGLSGGPAGAGFPARVTAAPPPDVSAASVDGGASGSHTALGSNAAVGPDAAGGSAIAPGSYIAADLGAAGSSHTALGSNAAVGPDAAGGSAVASGSNAPVGSGSAAGSAASAASVGGGAGGSRTAPGSNAAVGLDAAGGSAVASGSNVPASSGSAAGSAPAAPGPAAAPTRPDDHLLHRPPQLPSALVRLESGMPAGVALPGRTGNGAAPAPRRSQDTDTDSIRPGAAASRPRPPRVPESDTKSEPEAKPEPESTTGRRTEPPGRPAAGPNPESPRVQTVPTPQSCAIPPDRGLVAEHAWFRRSLPERYDAEAGSIARLLAETPGLRSGAGDTVEHVITDLVAARLYLAGNTRAFDDTVRSNTVGAHVPLSRCIMSGLRRLPSHRGATRIGATLRADERQLYADQRTVTEWSFCPALAGGRLRPPGTTEVLIWSVTSRRTALLDPELPEQVVFLPGTRFSVLRVEEGEHPRILLRELAAGEEGAGAPADRAAASRKVLDEMALRGLEQTSESWQESPDGPGPRVAAALAAGRFASPPGLIVGVPRLPTRSG